MTTVVSSNNKAQVTQNRIGKLKKRMGLHQMKIGAGKKEPNKPLPKPFHDEHSHVSRYNNKNKLSQKKSGTHGVVRQPLRNIQPNLDRYHYDPDPSRRQAEPLYKGPYCSDSSNKGPYVLDSSNKGSYVLDNSNKGSYVLDSSNKGSYVRQYTVDEERDDVLFGDAYKPSYGESRSMFYLGEEYEEEEDEEEEKDKYREERKVVGIVPPSRPSEDTDIDMGSLNASIGELFPCTLPSRQKYGAMQDWYVHDEYRDDVIAYMTELDHYYTITSLGYLYNGDIQANMRTILVDWLIQVQVHQDLLDETLHMTVSLIDRYHAQHIISVPKYQLLGISCLFVAAKYCERFPPLICDLVKLTENTYSPEHVLRMELKILTVLQFDLTFVEPHCFLEKHLHMFGYHKDKMVRHLCHYMLDLCLVETKCVLYRRSALTLNIVCLSKMILDESARYHLMPHCNQDIAATLALMLIKQTTAEQTAAKVKYSSITRYHAISHLPSINNSPVVTSLANDVNSTPELKRSVRFMTS